MDSCAHRLVRLNDRDALPLRVVALALALVAAAAGALASRADAHGVMLSAVPAPASVVERSPREVRIEFLSEVQITGGSIVVSGAGGASADMGAATVSRAGPTTIGMTSRVANRLADGVYTVSWTAVFEDGHQELGAYDFTILAAGGSGGITSSWAVSLAVVAGIVAVGALAWFASAQRRHAPRHATRGKPPAHRSTRRRSRGAQRR